MPQKFLSDEWLSSVFALQAEYRDKVPAPIVKMRLNQEVTGAPFGEGGVVKLHVDTTSRQTVLGKGHLETPDTTVSLDYDTAKALMVNQDQQAVMQAFMQGKIKVQGDMTKLMAMQSGAVDPTAAEVAARIAEVTE